MKKLTTLVAASALVASTLGTQAQTLDGILSQAELTANNYTLVGKFTNPRGFGDFGLLSLYVGSTATKTYIFVGGTVENNLNGFQIFMKTPASAGVPRGTALPAGTAGTYFEKMTSKMDMPVNLALAFRADAAGSTVYQVEAASYASATSATSKKLTTTANAVTGTGAPYTLPTDAGYPALAGARVAYLNTPSGKLVAAGALGGNPGNTNPNTLATYGAAGTYGLEIELDRTATGLVGANPLTLFVLMNGQDGGYISTDFIPQTTAPNGNLATGAYDFTALAGVQAATVNLAAAGGATLGNKAAVEALALGVYPNPVQASSTVTYQVADQASNVNIALTDLLGRQVRTVESGLKPVGAQTATLNTTGLAAGTYLVRVQVGDRVSTNKVSVL